jgi:hypothetical protein
VRIQSRKFFLFAIQQEGLGKNFPPENFSQASLPGCRDSGITDLESPMLKPTLDSDEREAGRRLVEVVRESAESGVSQDGLLWILMNLMAALIATDRDGGQRTATLKLIVDEMPRTVWNHVVARMQADKLAAEGHGQIRH